MNFLTCHLDESRIGALILAALGVGFFVCLPECVVTSRYCFAAVAVILAYRASKRFRRPAWRIGIPAVTALLMLILLFSPVKIGAKIALGGWFIGVFGVTLQNMLLVRNKWERAALGAAGIAALLLGVGIWGQSAQLNIVECQKVFGAALLAGSLTLFLQPFKRGEK